MRTSYLSLFILSILLVGCSSRKETLSGLNPMAFRKEVNGKQLELYVLTNSSGMEACITNYGGRLVSLMVPDRSGKMEDVVCGYGTIDEYLNTKQNFGATIGRYIGRIINARFTLDSVTYKLVPNTGEHSAHGGDPGFASKIWDAEQTDASTLKLTYLSPDGENGFPGNLRTEVIYRLTDDNGLDISYKATTDKPTVVNLSHHSFFNISGDLSSSVEDQLLYVNADKYTPYDSLKRVTGEIIPVDGSPFDFRIPMKIGAKIDEDTPQIKIGKGYDHNLVLNTNGDDSILAARLNDDKSGRVMEIYTSEPGLQVYVTSGWKGNTKGKHGIAYPRRGAICLETQHFADSPNQPQFPSTVLRPGEIYRSHCLYKFGVWE